MAASDHVNKLQTRSVVGDPSAIPPEFGTRPIPHGMVRINHYTSPEAVESIKATGLKQAANRDKVGDESFVFATAGHPGDLLHRAPVVEAYADASRKGGQLDIGENWRESDPVEHATSLEARRSTVTLRGDLPASQIIGIHEPWHEHARYLAHEDVGSEADPKNPYATGSLRSQVARGEHDDLPKYDRSYGPALNSVRITNAATVMLGGKL